mgnify:CR=1 FL=1
MKPVIVTTEHKGVFFGYIPEKAKTNKASIVLKKARMCVYWSSDVRGVIGLGKTGPSKNCKIGPACDSITLFDLTAVMDATPEAVKAWENAPWN